MPTLQAEYRCNRNFYVRDESSNNHPRKHLENDKNNLVTEMLHTYWHILCTFLNKNLYVKSGSYLNARQTNKPAHVITSSLSQFSVFRDKNMLKFVNDYDYKVTSNVAGDKLGKYTHLTFE
jgi:hypothetical protein